MKTAVVLTFDRLALRVLGCYGCVSAPTPHFDRFAAEAIVFDQHFAENTDRAAKQHAGWTGRFQFPLTEAQQQREPPRLLQRLQQTAVRTHLLQETTARLAAPVADVFEACQTLQTLTELFAAAENILQTELFPEKAGNLLLWISAAGLMWDDCPPLSGLPAQSDKAGPAASGEEAIWSRYSAQFRQIDEAFGRFRDSVFSWQQESGSELLMCVSAAEGQPLGEQQIVPADFRLPASLQPLGEGFVHIPLLIHEAGGAMGTRRDALVQSIDWAPTLLEWFCCPAAVEEMDGRSLLPLVRDESGAEGHAFVVTGDGRRAAGLRTADFYLMAEREALESVLSDSPEEKRPEGDSPARVESSAEEEALLPPGVRLFVKPDDLWEVNNVADQEPEHAMALWRQLQEFLSRPRTGV